MKLERDSVTFRETKASDDLPAIIEFTFASPVFDEATGLLSISQTGDVTHEHEAAAFMGWT